MGASRISRKGANLRKVGGWARNVRVDLTNYACEEGGHTSEFPFGIYWWTLKSQKNKNFEKIFKKCWRFRPFFALLLHYWHQKLKFGKNVRNTCRYYFFTHMHHKSRSYDVWFLRYKVKKANSFVIMRYFLLFDPANNRKNQNFEKIKKTLWKYYHFTLVYHKWQPYNVWLLRYQIRQSIFCHFVLLFPLV